MSSRREFIKTTGIAASALFITKEISARNKVEAKTDLSGILKQAEALLMEWADALLPFQVDAPGYPLIHGGLLCPAHGLMHGRSFDCMSAWLYRYEQTKDQIYLDAVYKIYDWTNYNMSRPDGSWVNDFTSDWKGITVFGSATVAHCIRHYGHLLPEEKVNQFKKRLNEAAEYIYKNFYCGFTNINYPATATYTLYACGEVLNENRYKEKATEIANDVIKYISPNDHLIIGEGKPYDKASPKGRFPVDLGYNVEETLQALYLYSVAKNDAEFEKKIVALMQSHSAFMLPDGGWDNSWGTRQFKWSYWGSRTSDGCVPAFTLASKHDPMLYKVASLNLQLLKSCTHKGLLTGGPHYNKQGMQPCLHHTFCHVKALEALLKHEQVKSIKDQDILTIQIPREKNSGMNFYKDIGTWVISNEAFTATVTDYDLIYSNLTVGHPSGGSISQLYHRKAGNILSGSMNDFRTEVEPINMQPNPDTCQIPLTPAIVMKKGDKVYRSNNDLSAKITAGSDKRPSITAEGVLCDVDQKLPEQTVNTTVRNTFQKDAVIIEWKVDNKNEPVFFSLPLISQADEKYEINDKECVVHRDNMKILVQTNGALKVGPTSNGRIFNNVPGLQAIPLEVYTDKTNEYCKIIIKVIRL